jgi:hypothetical protein
MNSSSFPQSVIRNLKQSAPLSTEIENGGRRFGLSYDRYEGGRGYKDFCIYVQNGLADQNDLFNEIVSGLYRINSENYRNCRLYIFGFGISPELTYDKSCIISGYWSDRSMKGKIMKAMAGISGQSESKPSFLPALFPETGIGNYFTRKSKIETSDLIIIIGNENEVILNESLKSKILSSLRKHVLFVEIGSTEVKYKIKEFNFTYSPLS